MKFYRDSRVKGERNCFWWDNVPKCPGVPKCPHQCSLPSQSPRKAPSNSPPKCSTSPTIDCSPSMRTEAAQELLPVLKAPFHISRGGCGSRGREGSSGVTCVQPCACHVPLPPCQTLPEQVHSKSYSNYHNLVLFGTKNCHPIPLQGMEVTESQKAFLTYNELPVNLQVQMFSVYKINAFKYF